MLIGVREIRRLHHFPQMFGVGCNDGQYFVFARPYPQRSYEWHRYSGPFETYEQAVSYIDCIKDVP